MAFEKPDLQPDYERLAREATEVFRREELSDPSLARAAALRHVVENCPITIEEDVPLLGGENPLLFNVMHQARETDRYGRRRVHIPDKTVRPLIDAGIITGASFEGHITPGLEQILHDGISGVRKRAEEQLKRLRTSSARDEAVEQWYEAVLSSCESVLIYARRYAQQARALAEKCDRPQRSAELREAADILSLVPEHPANTFHQAVQSYWLLYVLVTVEMGGCCPGGGLGLGRLDQFLLPYYRHDVESGRLTRDAALERMEWFLLNFRHVDFSTWHQIYTPGSQASLGGISPSGAEASNELTELIMEASLRIAMPAPYISLRLHRDAPERYWQAAANYVLGGLGFPVVNDEAVIPAMLRHGRSLADARDYLCSCCYEHTIPGREAFNPGASTLNLPFVLELALNDGRSLLSGTKLGCDTPDPRRFEDFEEIRQAFRDQLHFVCDRMVQVTNAHDEAHVTDRRYPLMSAFIDDCIARGRDVCSGGARYNLTGCIVVGIPNVLDSLAAIRQCVFVDKTVSMDDLVAALRSDFEGYEGVRQRLRAAPKWGNNDPRVDDLAAPVTELLYAEMASRTNARGGRWQLAAYSFVFNNDFGAVLGASADGRRAREILTRNLNPAWGEGRKGPTAVLGSLGRLDFSLFPNGSALDLRFDPRPFAAPAARRKFADFLRGFVSLKVMEMQVTMAGTEMLLEAKKNPQEWPDLMVKVAGFSARFAELSDQEKDEIIHRSTQQLGRDR